VARGAVAATLALITLGGVVRITGSGLGCGDDWPLCHGALIPPLDLPTLIEYGHRLAASVVSLLVLLLLVVAWTRHRKEPALRGPATVAAVLLAFQVLLGAVTVWLHLLAASVVLHLATAMILLAVLVVASVRSEAEGTLPRAGTSDPGAGARSASIARVAVALGFATLVAGGLVANLHAGPACRGFPLCNGALLPAADRQVVVHWGHRLLAFTLLTVLAVTFARARGADVGGDLRARRVRRLSACALALALAQVGLAASMVLLHLPAILRGLHLALGALLWIVLVTLASVSSTLARPHGERSPVEASSVQRASSKPPRRARRADVPA
jgi:heme A synthase